MYLDYAGIRVTNLARSIRFFERGLGLDIARRGTMHHGGKWVLLEDPRSHQMLELNWYPEGNAFWTPFVAGEGLDHLGVRVEDLPGAARRLRSAGGKVVAQIPAKGKAELVYVAGPDGIWIELIRSPTETRRG
jgi:catechol 2,3-dioxygenase-like lactoylglutathione lyase family enzyme